MNPRQFTLKKLCVYVVLFVCIFCGIYWFVQDSMPMGIAAAELRMAQVDPSSERTAKIERLYKSVLTHHENLFGKESETIVRPLIGLAKVQAHANDNAQALSNFRRAEAIQEKHSRTEDLITHQINVGMADVYMNMNEPAKAEPLYEVALRDEATRSAGFEPNYIEKRLADAYTRLNKYEKAESLYEKVLPSEEKLRETQPYSVAVFSEQLAQVYSKLGKYDKAEPLYLSALAEFKKPVPGSSYSQSLNLTLQHYAELLRATGRDAEAEALQKQFPDNLK